MNGINLELHFAEIKDNDDPKKAGRVKIFCPVFHTNLDESLLPWAVDFCRGTGGSSTYGKSDIPEIGSKVWIGFYDPNDLKKPFYIADIHLLDFHPHLLFQTNVKSIIGSSSLYPNTKYTYYKNGICVGVDSSATNPEVFISHPLGAYITIDKLGKINIKGSLGTLQKSILGETLKTVLEALIDAINTLTVTCPAGGGPSSTPINTSTFTAIKTSLTTILSLCNKNN